MKNRLSLIVLTAGLLASAVAARAQDAASASDAWDARLSDFKGDVKVYAPGEDKALPVEKGMPLEDGDRITTGADSSAELSFDAGTLVHLSAATDFTISETKRSQTAFKLTAGTFLGKIQKLLAAQSLIVQSPTAVAAVRGTEFGVEVDAANPDDSHVGVFDEGKVEVKGQAGGSEMIIGGQETKVSKGAAPLHAYQLQRFIKHRSFMRVTMKRHLQTLRQTWKRITPEQRKDLRKKALARLRAKAKDLEKKAADDKQKGDKKGDSDRRGEKESRQKREKMEKFRESIRNRKAK